MLKRIFPLFLLLWVSGCSTFQSSTQVVFTPLVQTTETATPVPEIPTVISENTATATSIPLSVEPISLKEYRPLLLAHYMPWYQGSPSWGWHWTMSHFSPHIQDEAGKRQIASHFYPLTGPYDSGDIALLEYQVMLMKLSGIDGVIVDWYGIKNQWDYALINQNTKMLFDVIEKAGLYFVICFEDSTIGSMIEAGALDSQEKYDYGKQAMVFLQENWFETPSYLKFDERPVLLVFGNPPYFKSSSDWDKLFAPLPQSPYLITEDRTLPPVSTSSYPWPPMSRSNGGTLSRESLNTYFQTFYNNAKNWDYLITSAFPGFYDIYEEAGVHSSFGYIDAQNGNTFQHTLELAFANNPDVIQLVTWNDYGEGTNIEPTFEYEYTYLEIIQKMKRGNIDAGFPYSESDLRIPLKIYNLRLLYQGDVAIEEKLDRATLAVFANRLDVAESIIETIQ